jgi:hypothetical protein
MGQAPGTSIRQTLLSPSTKALLDADESGYADIKLNVPGPDGRAYEVQISTDALMKAKETGHKYYDLVRSLDAKVLKKWAASITPDMSNAERRAEIIKHMPPMQRRMRAEAIKKSHDVYLPPFEAFLARSSKASNSASVISLPSSSIEKAGTAAQPLPGKNLVARRVSLQSSAGVPSTSQNVITGAGSGVPVLPTTSTPPSDVQSLPQEPGGSKRQRVITSSGREFDTEYTVVDANDLITSDHPDFPAELQPRQRDRVAAKSQVENMARTLKPELLLAQGPQASGGTPIVDDTGRIVESGNGRVMALRQAYASVPERAAAYRKALEAKGFDTTGIQNPVLVRRRTAPMSTEDRKAFTVEANTSGTMRLSPVEQATTDAQLLDADVLDMLNPGAEIDALANVGFVRAFVAKLSVGDRNSIAASDGTLSQEGMRRIQAALLARAYGGTPESNAVLMRALEATDDNIRSINSALLDAAPEFAARSRRPPCARRRATWGWRWRSSTTGAGRTWCGCFAAWRRGARWAVSCPRPGGAGRPARGRSCPGCRRAAPP